MKKIYYYKSNSIKVDEKCFVPIYDDEGDRIIIFLNNNPLEYLIKTEPSGRFIIKEVLDQRKIKKPTDKQIKLFNILCKLNSI